MHFVKTAKAALEEGFLASIGEDGYAVADTTFIDAVRAAVAHARVLSS